MNVVTTKTKLYKPPNSPQIELFKPYKMVIEHAEKYAALENSQRPHYQKSMGKPLFGKVWVI